MRHTYLASALLILATAVAAGAFAVQEASSVPSPKELLAMRARFAPADIGADVSALPETERRALAKLIDAARVMDALFLRQVWAGNDALLQELSRKALERTRSGGGAGELDPSYEPMTRLHYFLINKGPWSRLDHDRPFIAGVPAKPDSANFYPAGATKEEVQKWIDSLNGDARTQATGFFTTIRRAPGST